MIAVIIIVQSATVSVTMFVHTICTKETMLFQFATIATTRAMTRAITAAIAAAIKIGIAPIAPTTAVIAPTIGPIAPIIVAIAPTTGATAVMIAINAAMKAPTAATTINIVAVSCGLFCMKVAIADTT